MNLTSFRRPLSAACLFVTIVCAASSGVPASAQSGKTYSPNSHGRLQPPSVAAGAARKARVATTSTPAMHLLWSNTDHRAMFWNVNADGTFTVAGGYGPYTDGSDPTALWTATAIATGPDGVSHILWNNADHRVMLWDVQNNGSFQVLAGFGPYQSGTADRMWSAVGLSVGPDNVMHIAWKNMDHSAMFWDVQQDGSFQVLAGYGSYTDNGAGNIWDVVGVSTGPDNVSHLLWSNTDNRAMFWNVSNTDGTFNVLAGYGPYTDDTPAHIWDAVGVSTGPDNVSHLLWSNTDHRAMFWNAANTDGSFKVLAGYGPYSDDTPAHLWDAVSVATGSDNVSHLLWSNTDHRAMFWNVSNTDGSFKVLAGYGPYTDDAPDHIWNAVSVSVGP